VLRHNTVITTEASQFRRVLQDIGDTDSSEKNPATWVAGNVERRTLSSSLWYPVGGQLRPSILR